MELSALDRMTSLAENEECHYCGMVVNADEFKMHVKILHPDRKYARLEEPGPPVLKRIRGPKVDEEAQAKLQDLVMKSYQAQALAALKRKTLYSITNT